MGTNCEPLVDDFKGGGPGVNLTLCCFVVYSTRRFVVCLSVCHFVLVFFSPFSIAITSLGEERANLSAFRTFVRFVLVWICRFPLPLGVWEGLRFVIVDLPGLFSYLFLFLFCYERDFMMSLSENKQSEVIEAFSSTSSYLDDLLNTDNKCFDDLIS